jgi:hypothetical protein
MGILSSFSGILKDRVDHGRGIAQIQTGPMSTGTCNPGAHCAHCSARMAYMLHRWRTGVA